MFPGGVTSSDQLAHPATTKIVSSDVGIQTDFLERSPPMPIGSRSDVDSSGFTACPLGVAKAGKEHCSSDGFVDVISGGCHAVCGFCNHSVDLALRPLYRARSVMDNCVVHFLDCVHCHHQTEFNMDETLLCLPAPMASDLEGLFGVDRDASKAPINSGDIAKLLQEDAEATNMLYYGSDVYADAVDAALPPDAEARGRGGNPASSKSELQVPPPPAPVEPRPIRARAKTAPALKYIVSVSDKAKLTKLSQDRYNEYYHEILHLGNCGNCEICNVAKQRRKYHKPIKPSEADYATKMYEKTMFDTVETGKENLCKGINGYAYGTAVKDEASDFSHFNANRKKDHIATGEAIREYFGNDMKLAKGFYTDGARAFVKIARIMRISGRLSVPNTPQSNSRMETWMRVLGDGARTLLYSAGLSVAWWPFAYSFYCLAHNLLKINPRTGMTPYKFRFPNAKPCTIHPFGCRVTYVPHKIGNTNKNGEPMASQRGVEGILIGYYVPPGEPCSGKVAVIAPLANFTTSSFSYKIVTSQDFRFHGIEYPLRKLRYEHQLSKYMAVNPNISEEDYRTMIFGPSSDLGKNVFDPSEGANLEGGEPLEVVDSDIIDYENIPMEELYEAIRSPSLAAPPHSADASAMPPSGSRSKVDEPGFNARAEGSANDEFPGRAGSPGNTNVNQNYNEIRTAQKAKVPEAVGEVPFSSAQEAHEPDALSLRAAPDAVTEPLGRPIPAGSVSHASLEVAVPTSNASGVSSSVPPFQMEATAPASSAAARAGEVVCLKF